MIAGELNEPVGLLLIPRRITGDYSLITGYNLSITANLRSSRRNKTILAVVEKW